MSSAVADLLDAVVAAINAANVTDPASQTVISAADFAVTLLNEDCNDWQVLVQPGPWKLTPATLDGSATDSVSAWLVVWKRVLHADTTTIRAALAFVEDLIDAAVDGMAHTYCFVGAAAASGESAAEPYDLDRLRGDGIFHGQILLTFEAVRSQ